VHLSKNVYLIVTAILSCIFAQSVRAERTDTITQYGITWKLSEPAEVAQFVTGDYYVVGACEVVSITPPSGNGRNGSELNPPIVDNASGYASREEADRYDPKMCTLLPIHVKPGDALISTISATDEELAKLPAWIRRNEHFSSPVKSPV